MGARRLLLAIVISWLCAGSARAAPFRGDGSAKASETKAKTSAAARERALGRARRAALEKALGEVKGAFDRAARRTVLKGYEGWTGAYRVLSERVEGSTVKISVEVEVDVARLGKRLTPRPTGLGAPMFRLKTVTLEGPCGTDREAVTHELTQLGALGTKSNVGVVVALRCERLGPVEHTFVEASRVTITARTDKGEVGRTSSFGFGPQPDASVAQAVNRAVVDLAAELGQHRRGQLLLRVQSPLPSSRVRRLEKTMRSSVRGVTDTEVAGIEPGGAVLLRVHGDVRAETLSRRLQALKLPGFSLRIVGIDGPDALTIRLQ